MACATLSSRGSGVAPFGFLILESDVNMLCRFGASAGGPSLQPESGAPAARIDEPSMVTPNARRFAQTTRLAHGLAATRPSFRNKAGKDSVRNQPLGGYGKPLLQRHDRAVAGASR